MRENIIISDLHGCRAEFNQLLDIVKYNPKKHRLILVGDILDRGPDPVGLLHQIKEMDLECVLGNHEEKALRWRRHEGLRALTGKENPMKTPVEPRIHEWKSLSQSDLKWLSNLPLKIYVKESWYALHAGVEPAFAFEEQDISKIIRIRYVDKKTLRYVKPKTKEQPPNTYFWAEKWNAPINIVFGHQRHNEPTRYINGNNKCIAIDTGCCFGGSLTAYHLEDDAFIQIKASKTHYTSSNKK